jgi:hypothetical protein
MTQNWYICALYANDGGSLKARPIAALTNVPDDHNEDSIIEHFQSLATSAQFDESDNKPWANHCVISCEVWNSTAYIGCSRVQHTETLPVIGWVEKE